MPVGPFGNFEPWIGRQPVAPGARKFFHAVNAKQISGTPA
jgi:hypothetical protein